MTQISLAKRLVITNPEERIRDYCKVEIYRGFDDCHDVSNSVTPWDIQAANRLYARIRGSVARGIMQCQRINTALAAVPNTELGCIDDDGWNALKWRFYQLLEAFCSLQGVGIAVATKVLHLKRPEMIPIIDSFVAEFLLGIKLQNITNKATLVQKAVECTNIIRRDIRRNLQAFTELREQLSNLPIPLTKVRLYDILVWSIQKWDVKGDIRAPFGVPRTAGRTVALTEPVAGAAAGGVAILTSGAKPAWKEIGTVSDFSEVRDRQRGYICITDIATGNKIHSCACRWLSEKNFTRKVIINRCKNGHYYWVESIEYAKKTWDAQECDKCLGRSRH